MDYLLKKFKNGFTFIEVLIVLGVVGLTIPALFAIFFAILQQQAKVFRLTEIKRQGDYALNIMSSTIRNNAKSLYSDATLVTEQCDDAGENYSSTVYFRDANNAWFTFGLSSSKISSSSSALAQAIDLTNTKTTIRNFTLSCQRKADFSTPVIYISFDIDYTNGVGVTPIPNEQATMHYQTKVKLRSY